MSEIPEWVLNEILRLERELNTYWVTEYRVIVARALMSADREATERERNWLNAMPTNWELSCENEDTSDASSDLVWVVYSVNGGRNDREWSKLGQGDTPSNAISAAFIAAAIRKGTHHD